MTAAPERAPRPGATQSSAFATAVPGGSRPARELADVWIVTIATLIGLALRLYLLPQDDAWWDEIVTATRAMLPLDQLLTSLKYQGPSPVMTDCSPPLHHLFIHYSLLLGRTDFFLKLPNALFGSLTIPVVYLMTKRLYGSRAGAWTALFVALTAFHVGYSRDARWYSLYYLTATFTLWAFLAGVQDGRRRFWVFFSLGAAAMCYASYTAVTFLAGLTLAMGVWRLFFAPRDGSAGRTLARFVLALLAAGAAYLPWVEGQISTYFAFHAPSVTRPFVLEGFLGYLPSFLAPYYFTTFDLRPLAVVVAVAGTAAFLGRRRFFPLLALLAWTATPVIAAYNAKIDFGISPKYIMSLFFFLAVMAGAGADGLGLLAARLTGRRDGMVRLVVGAALTLGLCTLSLAYYPGHFRDALTNYKGMASWLAREQYNADYLLFAKSRQHKAILDWYLPGQYKTAGDLGVPGYKRAVVLEGWSGPAPASGGRVVDDVLLTRLGILNRSPLLVAPDAEGHWSYADAFTDFRAYSDAARFSNVCVQPTMKNLALYDLTAPGEIEYALLPPAGLPLASLTVRLQVLVERVAFIEPDAALEVLLATGDGPATPLARVDASSFPAPGGLVDVVASVPSAATASPGPLRIVLKFHRGERAGEVMVRSLAFEAAVAPGQVPPTDTAARYAAHIAAHATTHVWTEESEALGLDGPYVFDLADPAQEKSLQAYASRHPDARPVTTLADDQGRPRFVYHDPLLQDPFLRLKNGLAVTVHPVSPRHTDAYVLSGRLDYPSLRLDDAPYPLTLKTPPGTVVTVVPGGVGRLSLRPRFTRDAFDPGQLSHYDGIRTLPGQECLTCAADRGCRFGFRFASLYPMTEIRVVWYPRLLSDRQRQNKVTLGASLDGAAEATLDEFRSTGSGIWDGPERRVSVLKPKKPANQLDLSFTLPSDATQLWSSDGFDMVIEAKLDTRSAPRLQIVDRAQLRLEGSRVNAFGLFLPEQPPKFFDNLEQWP